MLESIRTGAFDPDMKAVQRMKVIAQRLTQVEDEDDDDQRRPRMQTAPLPEEPEPNGAESEAGSLSSGSEEPGDSLQMSVGPRVRSPFTGVDLTACWTHKVSGITHVIRDEKTLMCGRYLSSNFVRTEEAGIAGVNPECCHQCNRCLDAR